MDAGSWMVQWRRISRRPWPFSVVVWVAWAISAKPVPCPQVLRASGYQTCGSASPGSEPQVCRRWDLSVDKGLPTGTSKIVQQTDIQGLSHSNESPTVDKSSGAGDNLGIGKRQRRTAYLDQVIEEISKQLHDSEHVASNISRARHLQASSGLSEQAFVWICSHDR